MRLKGKNRTVVRATAEKEKLKILHAEDVTALAKQNYEDRKDPNKGFSPDRSWQKIASFSTLGWLKAVQKYPEISSDDPQVRTNAMRKAVNDEEFYMYRSAGGSI